MSDWFDGVKWAENTVRKVGVGVATQLTFEMLSSYEKREGAWDYIKYFHFTLSEKRTHVRRTT